MNLSWFAVIFALPVSLAAQNFQTLTPPEKLRIHAARIVDPLAIFGSAAGAAIEQWRNDPPEWHRGLAGYGRRFASVHGYTVVQNAFASALDTTLHQDPRYFRSQHTKFWPRARDAMLQTLVTRTDRGSRAFNYWRAGSHFGAGLLSNAWYPDRVNTVGDGLERASIGLGYDTLSNVIREFWPDIKKKLRH